MVLQKYDVHRADLQKALLKIINKEEIQIEKNSEIIDLCEEANGAFIKTKDRVIRSDAVIGADGIHSIVRKKLWGEDQARYTGNVAWRMLVPIEEYLQNSYNKIPKFGWDPRNTLYNIWLKVEIF